MSAVPARRVAGDALVAAQAFKHDADLFFGRELRAARPPNVLHNLFRAIDKEHAGKDQSEIVLQVRSLALAQTLRRYWTTACQTCAEGSVHTRLAKESQGSSALPAFARRYQGVLDPLNDSSELAKPIKAATGDWDREVILAGEPFVGLRAMDESWANRFFGRKAEVRELI